MTNTNDSDSFISEVEERVRQDQMMGLLKRFGPWFGALAAALIIGVGGWQAYEYFSVNTARAQSDKFQAAQEQISTGDLQAALASYEQLSSDGPASYRAMALMQRAALLQEQGDLDGAISAFDQAAETIKDPLARDAALLRAALLAAERQDFQAVRTRLQPIVDSDTAMSYLAREALGIEAWEAGDAALAREMLEGLTLSIEAPDTVRQRAEMALSVIGPAPEPGSTEEAPAAAASSPTGETAAPDSAATSGESE